MKNKIITTFLSFFVALAMLPTLVSAAPAPAINAEEIIKDIISVVGLKPNFEVRVANIPNAAAVTWSGKRYIAYNPEFITKLNAAAGNKWASVSVLAHEVGHHLNGHTLTGSGSQPAQELEADEFSGFVLKKMGATLAQAQTAMKIAANYKQSLTHPGQQDRLVAIANGWNKASAALPDMAKYDKADPVTETYAKAEIPTNPAYNRRPAPARSAPTPGNNMVLNKKFILASVSFAADRNTNYYVTKDFNLVKLLNNKLYVMGKMLPTRSQEYPFVMQNSRGTLFVDKGGKILTSTKEVAGFLTVAE